MPKPFNPALHADIQKLNRYPKYCASPEYKKLFEEIMLKYSISKATVYNELRKKHPGSYKIIDSRSNGVKINRREMDILSGYMITGKTNEELCRLMSVEMGFSYTLRRLYKAKKK